ncbi:polysaccharide pyruvyl transferase family protein [Lactococcus lactis]|uniref:polysaccharide pyruvyl transferase family protein n=1 Tax=Lactococcus lactis TaxID=1358 RepID=UPI00289090B6|nr:polysaccharide pyruvyl transferase family protein [Lactococcus lactis]MDT2926290.1 polysaccharide pyruvyl transferase family protein [Lactococcus lactis]
MNKSLSKIAESEKIIATRFHAMILGWLFQKPTFVISYSQKTTQVIENSFNKQTFVDYNKVEKLNLNNMDDYFVKIDDLTKEYLINDAQNQFRGLDSLLQS